MLDAGLVEDLAHDLLDGQVLVDPALEREREPPHPRDEHGAVGVAELRLPAGLVRLLKVDDDAVDLGRVVAAVHRERGRLIDDVGELDVGVVRDQPELEAVRLRDGLGPLELDDAERAAREGVGRTRAG